jgi:phosphomannomutase
MSEIKFGTDGWRGVIAEDFTYANVRKVALASRDTSFAQKTHKNAAS